jgi:uncharacterized membrane protein
MSGGGIGIVSGTIAVPVRKGERVHRASGIIFVSAMMTMAALRAYLAMFGSLSSLLVAIAIAPLVMMIFWIFRIRERYGDSAPTR